MVERKKEKYTILTKSKLEKMQKTIEKMGKVHEKKNEKNI